MKPPKAVWHLVRNKIEKLRKVNKINCASIEKYLNKAHPYGKRVSEQIHQPSVEDFAKLCILFNCEPEEIVTLDLTQLKEKIQQFKS